MTGVPDPFRDGLPVLDGVATGTPPRVRLRPPRAPEADGGADLDALFALFSDADALRYWSHGPLATRNEARVYLAATDGTALPWAVADAATDALVGRVTLHHWDRDNRRAEIGFMLARAHWGRGVASEAVRAALGYGFGALGLHRVEADVDPENAASLTLLGRLGFRAEGHLAERWFTYGAWRDTVLLGLLASDYVATPAVGHGPQRDEAD